LSSKSLHSNVLHRTRVGVYSLQGHIPTRAALDDGLLEKGTAAHGNKGRLQRGECVPLIVQYSMTVP